MLVYQIGCIVVFLLGICMPITFTLVHASLRLGFLFFFFRLIQSTVVLPYFSERLDTNPTLKGCQKVYRVRRPNRSVQIDQNFMALVPKCQTWHK